MKSDEKLRFAIDNDVSTSTHTCSSVVSFPSVLAEASLQGRILESWLLEVTIPDSASRNSSDSVTVTIALLRVSHQKT